MTISPIAPTPEEEYLRRQFSHPNRADVVLKDTPMLFIFNNKNSIQIAWGSKLSSHRPQSRLQQLDTRFGTIGFIRTYSAG
jgi:hypothetical protein